MALMIQVNPFDTCRSQYGLFSSSFQADRPRTNRCSGNHAVSQASLIFPDAVSSYSNTPSLYSPMVKSVDILSYKSLGGLA